MDIRSKIIIDIPKTLIKALRMTEETIFAVAFENNQIIIEPINEETDENDETVKSTFQIESEWDEWYEEGYAEGKFDGYEHGYSVGYDDAENQRDFDDSYPDDEATNCSYNCETCNYFNSESQTCESPEKLNNEE